MKMRQEKKLSSRHLLKRFFLVFAALNLLEFSFAENENSRLANKKTALRCLETASNYIFEKNWEAAKNQACFGIAYDDSVSDLWYLYAVSENALGKTKAAVLPLLEKAIKNDSWTNYNRDNARLLYADILCDTGRMSEALNVLDGQPFLYSSDSELIRIKCLYRLGDSSSVSKARNKIDGARRIYPSDTRFPLVFFKNESPVSSDAAVRRLSSFFVSRLDSYLQIEPENSELEIYSALFSSGETKSRILKSFNAKGFKHPLYAQAALDEGLMNEQEAAGYIFAFADEKIDYSIFKDFILKLSENDSCSLAEKYLSAFSGSFSFDTDKDGIENLIVKFSRGRPQEISFDKNQDGEQEWNVLCDFGAPVSGYCRELKMNFFWEKFPYLNYAEFLRDKEPVEKFNFVPETLKWSPVFIERDHEISEKLGFDLFIPNVDNAGCRLNIADFLDSASDFEISISGNEKIRFILLNGNIQQALYYSSDGRLYAQAHFENNIPVFRTVDFDKDGIFEVTEFYSVDSEKKMKIHSLEDERQIVKNLFGLPSGNAEFYLRMIQIDRNNDTVPDFTEEYLENSGKISSWDTDGDGEWNVRHIVYPDGISEESMFYTVPDKKLVAIKFENNIPQKVTNGNEEFFVYKDAGSDFYWLLKNSSFDAGKYSALAKKAKAALDEKSVQGASTITVENEVQSVLCIRIEKFDFGILIENENKN